METREVINKFIIVTVVVVLVIIVWDVELQEERLMERIGSEVEGMKS